jgi:hypothetical protein
MSTMISRAFCKALVHQPEADFYIGLDELDEDLVSHLALHRLGQMSSSLLARRVLRRMAQEVRALTETHAPLIANG